MLRPTKEQLIEEVYQQANRLVNELASRTHVIKSTGQRVLQYMIVAAAKDLEAAILSGEEDVLDYEGRKR
jgi:hypothetical protein